MFYFVSPKCTIIDIDFKSERGEKGQLPRAFPIIHPPPSPVHPSLVKIVGDEPIDLVLLGLSARPCTLRQGERVDRIHEEKTALVTGLVPRFEESLLPEPLSSGVARSFVGTRSGVARRTASGVGRAARRAVGRMGRVRRGEEGGGASWGGTRWDEGAGWKERWKRRRRRRGGERGGRLCGTRGEGGWAKGWGAGGKVHGLVGRRDSCTMPEIPGGLRFRALFQTLRLPHGDFSFSPPPRLPPLPPPFLPRALLLAALSTLVSRCKHEVRSCIYHYGGYGVYTLTTNYSAPLKHRRRWDP